MSTGDQLVFKSSSPNFCTRCGCVFTVPGTCNCFAHRPKLHPYTYTGGTHFDRCPCNPKNGGSGICGCVIGRGDVTW